jgi:NitT/TauT family transport system substrate-binding protein
MTSNWKTNAINRHPVTIAALMGAAALVLSGCSSPDTAPPEENEGSRPGAQETVTVAYGSFSTGTSARQVLYADEKGYFEEEGIELEVTTLMSTPSLASLLASGELDVATVSYQPAFNALAAGIDIRVLATIQAVQEGMQTVWVHEDSGIKSLEDLEEGARFGIASVGGYGELLLRESMEQAGLSMDNITFTEVAPPEAAAALERGDIDAAHLPSPFAAAIMNAADSPLTRMYDFADTPTLTGMVQGGLWANGQFADENPDVVEGFLRAVERAAAELEADPELDVEYLARLGKLEPAIAGLMPLERWVGKVTTEDLEVVIDLMVEHGMLEEGAVNVDDLN